MIEVVKCPNCGAPIPNNTNKCPYCQATIVLSQTSTTSTTQAPKVEPISQIIQKINLDYTLDYLQTFGYEVLLNEPYPNGTTFLKYRRNESLPNREYLDYEERQYIFLYNQVSHKTSKKTNKVVFGTLITGLSFFLILLGTVWGTIFFSTLYILTGIGVVFLALGIFLIAYGRRHKPVPFYLASPELVAFRERVKKTH
ncbi:MAG: zinc ribbon domain-containing protein [Acholeplasmatales bacterium]|jgi:type IV secretory pathway VirB6-like protein|nr:zinc ribbon domain-containing protein [Acholeplasmatales bacterium]